MCHLEYVHQNFKMFIFSIFLLDKKKKKKKKKKNCTFPAAWLTGMVIQVMVNHDKFMMQHQPYLKFIPFIYLFPDIKIKHSFKNIKNLVTLKNINLNFFI